MSNSKLLYLKKGDIKTGTFSKKIACEYSFYEDKIIIRPLGWNRLFNSADIVIYKEDIIGCKDSFDFLIYYNFILQTKRGNYTLRFMGDKLQIKQLLNEYCS